MLKSFADKNCNGMTNMYLNIHEHVPIVDFSINLYLLIVFKIQIM
jgi:hypothetical protein